MQCEIARQLMELCHPGLDDRQAPQRGELIEHLEQCPSCLARSRHLDRVDREIGRAMRRVPVPPDLEQRLLAGLQTVADAGPSRERREWHVPRIGWRYAGIGAGALTAAGLVFMLGLVNRPIRTSVAEVEQIAGALYDARSQTWQVLDGRFEHQFEVDQREQQRIEALSRPPAKLRSRYQVGMAVEKVLGHHVGMYCYYFDFDEADAPVKAHVYAFSDRRFRLEGLLQLGPPYGMQLGSENGLVIATWGESGFVYVMVYRGSYHVLDRAVSDRDLLTLAAATHNPPW